MGRVITWAAGGVLAVVLVIVATAAGVVSAVTGGGAGAGVCLDTVATAAAGTLTADQTRNAEAIAAEARAPAIGTGLGVGVGVGVCASGGPVVARAETWLTGWGGGPVPYLSSGDPGTWFGGYRRDCSGYASMALGLSGPGLNTAGLAARSTPVTRAELRPGDLLINTAPDLVGHVVIFDHWTDATMRAYIGYEQSGDGGTHHRQIPYPYFGYYPMTAYRYGPM